MAEPKPADLVLSGGGVKGIGLVGAVVGLMDGGYRAQRVSGTSAGSIVGAIVGELPSGFREGLGGSILLGMQYYTLSPEDLWATVIVAAGLGMLAFLAVVIAERLTLRNQRPAGILGA